MRCRVCFDLFVVFAFCWWVVVVVVVVVVAAAVAVCYYSYLACFYLVVLSSLCRCYAKPSRQRLEILAKYTRSVHLFCFILVVK